MSDQRFLPHEIWHPMLLRRLDAMMQGDPERFRCLADTLEVMRDTKNPTQIRLDAVKAVAPYLHAKRAPEDKGG